ncbi:MAG: hypothetical protein GX345_03595 [Clostridiales bacterium]|nr:hypothetical protein [Clostridiales bacterium]
MNKYKLVFYILFFLALASLASALVLPHALKAYPFKQEEIPDTQTDPIVFSESYEPALSGELEHPLLSTGLEGIFYSMDPATGFVDFYEHTAQGLAPYSGQVQTLKKSVTCSSRQLSTEIHYIEKEGALVGFGLYRPDLGGGSGDIFPYAFFNMVNLPALYGKSGALLLVDFEKENFWLADKLFTEAFIIKLDPADKTAKPLSADSGGRSVGPKGAMRDDWLFLTDDFLAALSGQAYFLSGRHYTLDQRGKKTDLLKVASPKPPRSVTGILGLWVRFKEDEIYYLKNSEKGFKLMAKQGKEEKELKSFQGNYEEDYLHDGDFLFHKKSLTLSDLLSGEDRQLEGFDSEGLFYLSSNPAKNRLVLAAPAIKEGDDQSLIFYDLEKNRVDFYRASNLFAQANPNFGWIGDSLVFHLKSQDDISFAYCIYDFSKMPS